MLIRVSIFIATLFIALHTYADDNKENLARENRLMESELSLVKKSKLYCIFDLKGKTIRIKAQGVILKEFPIHDVRVWGSTLPSNALVLEKKSTFVKPRRKSVRPAEHEETDSFEIHALELDDMPSRYTLGLDKRVYISVKPRNGFFSKTENGVSSLKNAIIRPFKAFWYAVRGQPYTAIDIFLDKKDAQALYWSFQEGTASVLYPNESRI